jgi:nucleotide-binding universal stress UspA family protein
LGAEIELEAGLIIPSHESNAETEELERDVWDRLHDGFEQQPSAVHVRISQGNRAQAFLQLAEERTADLLVVGAHQRHGLLRVVHHSFSRHVLAHASTNVLCVPLSTYVPDFRVPRVRRVLVATDFSVNGNAALLHAYSLLPAGGEIRLVHVCSALSPDPAQTPGFTGQFEAGKNPQAIRNKLESLIPHHLATSGVQTTPVVLTGTDCSEAICDEAKRFAVDLICLGTRSGKLAKVLLGSVSNGVVAHAQVPVLVVPAPRI